MDETGRRKKALQLNDTMLYLYKIIRNINVKELSDPFPEKNEEQEKRKETL